MRDARAFFMFPNSGSVGSDASPVETEMRVFQPQSGTTKVFPLKRLATFRL